MHKRLRLAIVLATMTNLHAATVGIDWSALVPSAQTTKNFGMICKQWAYDNPWKVAALSGIGAIGTGYFFYTRQRGRTSHLPAMLNNASTLQHQSIQEIFAYELSHLEKNNPSASFKQALSAIFKSLADIDRYANEDRYKDFSRARDDVLKPILADESLSGNGIVDKLRKVINSQRTTRITNQLLQEDNIQQTLKNITTVFADFARNKKISSQSPAEHMHDCVQYKNDIILSYDFARIVLPPMIKHLMDQLIAPTLHYAYNVAVYNDALDQGYSSAADKTYASRAFYEHILYPLQTAIDAAPYDVRKKKWNQTESLYNAFNTLINAKTSAEALQAQAALAEQHPLPTYNNDDYNIFKLILSSMWRAWNKKVAKQTSNEHQQLNATITAIFEALNTQAEQIIDTAIRDDISQYHNNKEYAHHFHGYKSYIFDFIFFIRNREKQEEFKKFLSDRLQEPNRISTETPEEILTYFETAVNADYPSPFIYSPAIMNSWNSSSSSSAASSSSQGGDNE